MAQMVIWVKPTREKRATAEQNRVREGVQPGVGAGPS